MLSLKRCLAHRSSTLAGAIASLGGTILHLDRTWADKIDANLQRFALG